MPTTVVGVPSAAELGKSAADAGAIESVEFQPALPNGVNDERVMVVISETVTVWVAVTVLVMSGAAMLKVVEVYGGADTVIVSSAGISGMPDVADRVGTALT